MIFEKKILDIYKKQLITRNDHLSMVHYYSHGDFEGLLCTPYSFISGQGQRLYGAFYYYNVKDTRKIVIFEHGLGGGHRSYMKEIEMLCRGGFTVFSYDHTGCGISEGDNIRAFSQSICDLDMCITSLRNSEEYRDADISVVGHSWGGLSSLNIGALHPDITHIVAISAPISVKAMISQFFSSIMRIFVPAVMRYEKEQNPIHATLSAQESLKSTSASVMVIHSKDDPTVKYDSHFKVLEAALKERENTVFVSTEGKAHNPNYTASAVQYKDAFFADLTEKTRSGYFDNEEKCSAFKKSYDFWKMTEQDETLWEKILKFLK